MLDFIVMQMTKVNREKGYSFFHVKSEKRLKILGFDLHQVKVVFKHISAGLSSAW